jgi:hypothetical protein
MNSTDFAASLHRSLFLFRDQREEVAAHAAQQRGGLFDLSHEAAEFDVVNLPSRTPAEFSEQILAALFGTWPRSEAAQTDTRTYRAEGVTVRELTWACWEQAVRPK